MTWEIVGRDVVPFPLDVNEKANDTWVTNLVAELQVTRPFIPNKRQYRITVEVGESIYAVKRADFGYYIVDGESTLYSLFLTDSCEAFDCAFTELNYLDSIPDTPAYQLTFNSHYPIGKYIEYYPSWVGDGAAVVLYIDGAPSRLVAYFSENHPNPLNRARFWAAKFSGSSRYIK